MADNISPQERSRQMALVRAKNTKPELLVRKLVFSLGYRYRLHDRKLPGNPDLVFPSRKKVIFIHGCFWHRHDEKDCKLTRFPKSNLEFWSKKFLENKERDAKNLKELTNLGWNYLIVWECQVKNTEWLRREISNFLS